MNFITASHAYALYGKETLEEFISLYVRDGREVRPAIEKYVDRGWSTFDGRISPMSASGSNVFRPTLRTVGDNNTWIIKIPGVQLSGLNEDEMILRQEAWALGFETNGKAFIDTIK